MAMSDPKSDTASPAGNRPMSARVRLTIAGLVNDIGYQMCKMVVEYLNQNFADEVNGIMVPLTELDYLDYKTAKCRELCYNPIAIKSNCLATTADKFIGDGRALVEWAQENYGYEEVRPHELYQAVAEEEYIQWLKAKKHPIVFLEFKQGSTCLGRLVIELLDDICPKTCANFLALCTGEKGSAESGVTLCYENTNVSRVCPQGWIQAGIIGSGSESIYGGTFPDECYAVPHDQRGVVGMIHKGRNENASHFYITLGPAPYLDTKSVAFARVVEGIQVLQAIEETDTNMERPTASITISRCGRHRPAELGE